MQPPFNDALKDIADSMGIALYQRFNLNEASLFLRCPPADIEALVKTGNIGHIRVSDRQLNFFGYQLLEHLLASVQGASAPPSSSSAPGRDQILRMREVQKMTGLSRTTLWRLERSGKFPARVPLSEGSIGWRLSEISAWIQSR